ncbi:hypothetical protein [Streptomyces sp. NBC_00448]|uniref:hypothetical protein n=1 Tax=Streptomyces sp. NBC_00448 TaxID=2903652 RepID=UPI002E2359D2
MVADEAGAPAIPARDSYVVGTICDWRAAGGGERWWMTSRTPAIRWSPTVPSRPPSTMMTGLSRPVA